VGAGHRRLIGIAALCFVASAAVTVAWCASMSSMPGMEMPGGWTMSMTWMRMPGQAWSGVAASFLGMWMVMMVAMMLPALVPMLAVYRDALPRGARARRGLLTLRVAAAYFGTWLALGALSFPVGICLAQLAMHTPEIARVAPGVAGIVLMIAGASQFSGWKRRQLERCRQTVDCCRAMAAEPRAAWRHGVDLGARCLRCCAPLTAALFVLGVMDLAAMAWITVAIGIERLLPRGERAARVIGVALLAGGIFVLTNT
jgi:predicted metal-binding membrane protein